MTSKKPQNADSGARVSASAEIAAALRARIESGELAEGCRVPSEHELARVHGISRNQAREILRELEWERFIVRRRGSGSYVAPLNGRISAIRPADTGTVAFIGSFPKGLSRYSTGLYDGFMRQMAESGRQTVTYNWQQEKAAELRLLRTLGNFGVAGLVAWLENHDREVRELVAELQSKRFPIVLVDRYLEGVETDCVASDNEAAGYRLTRALIEKGHRRIGFVGLQTQPFSSVRERWQGYRRALDEAGIAYDERLVGGQTPQLERDAGEYTNAVMALPDRPTAFVGIHDRVVKLLYDYLSELGYEIPEQVEFAALDDGHPPERPDVPMLRLRQQAHLIGATSASMLLERIENPGLPPRQVRVEPLPAEDRSEEERPGELAAAP